MMISRAAVLFTLLFFSVPVLFALTLDDELSLVTDVYNLKPEACNIDSTLLDEHLTPVGDVVFNTPVLSGDHDTSCSTCHIDSKHLTDGLPVSVGVGGNGDGMVRMSSKGVIVARNSFTLFGRASSKYQSFFWDGKVQEFEGKIYSPVGEGYSKGFRSPLAVAAVMPILARDEFLGLQSFLQSNEHLDRINTAYYDEKLNAANEILRQIIFERKDDNSRKLKKALQEAGVDEPNLPIIGNALASFIANKVQKCDPSKWDMYLSGNLDALSDIQKKGAKIFYGKGRCAGCHSGSLFTDFKFHSIGTPQGEFGTHIHRQDIGRAGVTYRTEDRYKFRTPPLIHVSKTAPYGHNGTFKTIEDVVLFHINPIPFFIENEWTSGRELLTYGRILSARSNILGFIDISDKDEFDALLEFLNAL